MLVLAGSGSCAVLAGGHAQSFARTLTGKKLEVPVKRLLQGVPPEKAVSEGAITHPEMLHWFARYSTAGGDGPPRHRGRLSRLGGGSG